MTSKASWIKPEHGVPGIPALEDFQFNGFFGSGCDWDIEPSRAGGVSDAVSPCRCGPATSGIDQSKSRPRDLRPSSFPEPGVCLNLQTWAVLKRVLGCPQDQGPFAARGELQGFDAKESRERLLEWHGKRFLPRGEPCNGVFRTESSGEREASNWSSSCNFPNDVAFSATNGDSRA